MELCVSVLVTLCDSHKGGKSPVNFKLLTNGER